MVSSLEKGIKILPNAGQQYALSKGLDESAAHTHQIYI